MATSLQETGWPFADGGEAGAALKEMGQIRPRLLALGEPMHGVEEFLRLRNELFQYLAANEGYRSIAIESDSIAGLMVDEYVAGGPGSLDDVMRHGFSPGFGELPGNRELIEWMRDANRTRGDAERLRFFGFDAPIEMMGAASPRSVLVALHAYLTDNVDNRLMPCAAGEIERLTGDDDRWLNPQAAFDPALSAGSSAEVATLRLIADDLRTLVLSESPRLIAATSAEDWWQACLYARTAAGLLRYHVGMAGSSDLRISQLLGQRDAMMAENLMAIAGHEAQHGPTLVFAHNRHLQREASEWELAGQALEWWSAGAIVSHQLGSHYAFAAIGLGAAPGQGLAAPAPDTLEGVLSTLPANRYLFSAESLAAALKGRDLNLRTDNTPTHGYFPLDPGHLQETDAVIFIKSAPGA